MVMSLIILWEEEEEKEGGRRGERTDIIESEPDVICSVTSC
jgi:hypothetical protein